MVVVVLGHVKCMSQIILAAETNVGQSLSFPLSMVMHVHTCSCCLPLLLHVGTVTGALSILCECFDS